MIQAALVIALTLASQTNNAAPAAVPPTDVQRVVQPILDLCHQAAGADGKRQNDAFFEAAKLIGKLSRDKGASSDEAFVVLMNFYVGESAGEDVLHQVTVRGKRMLPLLFKYQHAHVIFPNRDYRSILLHSDVRREDFENAIKSINAGKIIGED